MPASEPLRCKQCGGVAEEARRIYATTVCFKCLPPPVPLKRQAACGPPKHHAFDIEIYDCPCGHMYGDHEYHCVERKIVIDRCVLCDHMKESENTSSCSGPNGEAV